MRWLVLVAALLLLVSCKDEPPCPVPKTCHTIFIPQFIGKVMIQQQYVVCECIMPDGGTHD